MMPRYGDPFEILLVWSGKTLVVSAEQSALEVLLAADVPIGPGCMTGGCGECATRYVEGDVIHKESCLTNFDRKTLFCPCVSRARGLLALPF
ncbi:MAG: 2Fe-2S iron-sulfur cluster binding domain-containing protein [Proteobacteria bacterium]|nr:2Fe-2S iron-sulfur cluster binding domain-containing protein [Pseudomonadota bacterium]